MEVRRGTVSAETAIAFDRVSKTYSLAWHKAGGIKGILLHPREALHRMHAARREVLHDISFDVARGESVGIIGRNGVGKSTVLALIAGVLRPTSGTVTVTGRVSPLLELGAGFHPELTGRDNIFLNGVLLGMRRGEVARKSADIIAFAELEESIDEPLRVYSSGMMSRLGFAVAAHLEPEILLIDESLTVGDAEFQEKCIGKVAELHKRGVTTLLVSHDLESVARLCGRAMVLESRHIAFSGATAEAVDFYLDKDR
jgi:lipopolysaccharide transport system ATP-binding protein